MRKLAKSSLDRVPAIKGYSSPNMPLVRNIFALLIAVSVAMLPATGGAAFKSTSDDTMTMSAAEPMDDCCPDPANLCDKAMGDCGSMAACTLNCLSYAGGISSLLVYPVTLAGTMPLLESDVLHSHTSSPPFRPPRV
jgi:hypothetical protein